MNNEEYNFDDIEPLSISNESPETNDVILCKIMYSDEFKTVFSYLRALMVKDEMSKRALYASCRAISLVPAHYTAWTYKYRIVEELVNRGEYNIEEELEWCLNTALDNEKNYQIWHYREMIIELLIKIKFNGDKGKYDLDAENKVIVEMLQSDEKNYHVWSHKTWIVEYFGLFGDEKILEYTESLIASDVRNNSAWNHRHFAIFGNGESKSDVIEREIKFVGKFIDESITNPSSWNYIKSIFTMCKRDDTLNHHIEQIKLIVHKYSSVQDIEKELEDNNLSIPAIELLADLYEYEGNQSKQNELYHLLGEQLDPIRKNYWSYKQKSLIGMLNK